MNLRDFGKLDCVVAKPVVQVRYSCLHCEVILVARQFLQMRSNKVKDQLLEGDVRMLLSLPVD